MTARATATTAEGAATSSLTRGGRPFTARSMGGHMSDVHRCEKLGIRVERFDSPQNPLSVAAGCFSYEQTNGIDNELNPKEN